MCFGFDFCQYVRQSVSPSVCLSVCLSVRLSVCLSVCLSVRLSVCLSVCQLNDSYEEHIACSVLQASRVEFVH